MLITTLMFDFVLWQQTGFASTLLAAIGTQQVDLQSRLLAAIYLKNNILR